MAQGVGATALEPCVYTTTSANEAVKIIGKQEYAKRIYLEDGTELDVSVAETLKHIFPEAGEHKVWIEFKEDVTSFIYCFDNCSKLTSIPSTLFANNADVTDFSTCFQGCSGLTSIPGNLFENNTAVTDFNSCFGSCSGLTSIPANLFASNTAVTDFENCFSNCSGLTSIPSTLFAANTAVTDFFGCFQSCRNITSSCPVDKDGTPIYNRSGSGKEGYAVVSYRRYCFYGCTKMTDYASIPSDWK